MKKAYIFTDLAGGIGNQIFLLEMSKFVSSINMGDIYLNKFHIDLRHSSGKSTIEDFDLPSTIKFWNQRKSLAYMFSRLKRYMKYINLLPQNLVLILDDTDKRLNKKLIEQYITERHPKIIFIFGFWQSFEFWSDKTDYHLKKGSPSYRLLLEEQIAINPIIVHYRLGQISKSWESGWGALHPKYLLSSLEHIKGDWVPDSTPIWIFSNDISYAVNIFKELIHDSSLNFRFIDDENLSPAEIVLIFSKAKNLICGNSTMSIAAAKLGKVSNVIIPKELSINGDTINAIPKNWICIDPIWLDSP
jgi:hypothetical protein